MQILPPVIEPAAAPIVRRHRPRPASWKGGYREYRSCLRWDFGFTCPFCLLHEADFARTGGAEGSGLTSVEHLSPQSVARHRRNEYGNCVYCCAYCNRARSAAPQERGDCRLLDPTQDAWARHYRAESDCLKPVAGDADAQYTYDSYDFDDPRKVAMRGCRRRLITVHLRFLEEGPSTITSLLEVAEKHQNTPDDNRAVKIEHLARIDGR